MGKRAPESMIAKLRGAIQRMEKGPDVFPVSPILRDAAEAHAEAHRAEACWRESWLLPELRQLLCYLDGVATAHEILEYGHGYSYSTPKEVADA